jgi:uracil-DNA glycosylase family protein
MPGCRKSVGNSNEAPPIRAPYSVSASDFLPKKESLVSLRRAARTCQGCPLYRLATQTVFGEGPSPARLMLIGETPGDQEDREGRPFVGPAGRLLDDALAAAGLRRDTVYITNAVKHFKWEERGKRRLHKKPSAREMAACRPWLEAEIRVVRPSVIVCLGATAGQSLLGRLFASRSSGGRCSNRNGRRRFWPPITLPRHFAPRVRPIAAECGMNWPPTCEPLQPHWKASQASNRE